MLGAASLKRRYIGIEPCAAQVAGLRSMADVLLADGTPSAAEIIPGCAEDVMPLLPSGKAALVFSSPPYFDWEKYSDEDSQSFIRYASFEQWKEGFLEPAIQQSLRVLRRSGKFVVNISGGRRRPDADDVIAISLSAGFRYAGCVPLLIARVPYLHPRTAAPHKQEVILVFEKP